MALAPKKERVGRRRSDPGTVSLRPNDRSMVTCDLPWGATRVVALASLDLNQPSGPFVGQTVLLDLFNLFQRKLNSVIDDEPIEKLLNKTLQRGGDAYFDNLCRAVRDVCETCLPSVLKIILAWHDQQEEALNAVISAQNTSADAKPKLVKKLLAINYLFCLVLIEVLPTVEFHVNSCESMVKKVLDICFKNVQYREPSTLGVNNTNQLVVAETYGEVIGVLSSTHFSNIHRIFMNNVSELKKDVSLSAAHQIVALIMAMKFVKIKTNQVEEFEMGIKFLDDLGSLFLEVKDKDVKHAVMGLLVEILLPVAAQIKRETNIPALISLVSKLYAPTNELASKKQHKLAAYPLVTCLLCVSQRHFFLANWVSFLNVTLANLKNRDSRVSRVALESLYRLLWVYMIRINCDGNTATRSRLESICGSLFPKGNRSIVPRDAPLNIFVKIIHFIAQQKLDFAFKEVIFDLLGCNRTQRSQLYAERMNIGIRALMVIADGLQQKDEPPAMPKSMGPSASGTMQKIRKKTYITRPLTVEIAKSIGLEQYYAQCKKAFDVILRTLDTQIGKPLMMPTIQGRGKEPDELISGDTKPKLDLFRTCVAAIPRLLPDPMSHIELIDILTRLTVHIDEELRNMAGLTLQNIIGEFADWREHVFVAQVSLLQNQISDFYPNVLDDALRLLLQLLTTWKAAAVAEKKREAEKTSFPPTSSTPSLAASHQQQSSLCSLPENVSLPTSLPFQLLSIANVLHSIEGLALVYLCQTRSQPRKLAISVLKEVKIILEILGIENSDTPVISVLDSATPYVIKKYIEHVPLNERLSWGTDFASACDKIASIETDNNLVNIDRGNEYLQWDAWACALSGYAEKKHLLTRCPTAVMTAWPILFSRLNSVSGYVDPSVNFSNPQNESRASLLRGSKSKASVCGEALGQDGCLSLWQKYLILCCALAPAPHNQSTFSRSFSPTNSVDTTSDVLRSVSSSLRSTRAPMQSSLSQLMSKVSTILRWENMTDIRDSVVLGVGSINPMVFETFIDELKSSGILREAMEKKMETNLRRRKRKDLLRLQVVRVIEIAVWRGLLQVSMIDATGALHSTIVEFIESMRLNLENDNERDLAIVTQLRLHLAKLVALIVDSTPPLQRAGLIPSDKRQSLFYLFFGWCSRAIAADRKYRDKEVGSYVEQKSVLAMTRVLCCGPIFEANKAIGDDGYLYGWLEKLVVSTNPTMQIEVEELLAWMLEMNESSNLLDWLMSQCYSQGPQVSCRCFRALVRVFSRRDFPCEFVSLFVLCQSMLAYPAVTDPAVHMIELLRKQFLDSSAPPQLAATSPVQSVHMRSTGDIISPSATFGHSLPIVQNDVCKRLANTYPHLTVTIFSEVSSRLEQSPCTNKAHLLALLQPWIANLELVDPNVVEEASEGPRGWGSEEATQLVLNNMLHITAMLSADHEKEIGELWKSLAVSFPANLPAILNYFYTATLLAQDSLLSVTKRICVIMSAAVGNRLAAILLEWLSTAQDGVKTALERSEIPPFYRWRDESIDKKDRIDIQQGSPLRDQDAKDETSKDGVRLLPMPAYGGHYSQLCTLLPPAAQPVQFYNKSEVALLLICDIVRASAEVDWCEAAPLLLHSGLLSLDSLRPALCRHARQTIVNIVLLFVDKSLLPQVSAILLKNEMIRATETSSDGEPAVGVARGESPSFARAAADEYRKMLLASPSLFPSSQDLLAAVAFCLSENMDQPLWANEDATPRNWRVQSAHQLSCMVEHLVELLIGSMPMLPIMWTQLAMRMALATSQRHAAGRCFQIVSALRQPPGAWVPSLMSRLVETAGESHDETQAYVTDLLVCLVDCATHISPTIESGVLRGSISPTHARSTSYTPALVRQSVLCSRVQHQHDKKDARLSLLVADKDSWTAAETLVRSKSAEQLKSDMEADEETNARMQMCAIAIALLESALDNEFLLALQLLDKVLDMPTAQKSACLHKLDKTVGQLEWKNFNGVVALLTRGAIISTAYEPSIQAMIRVCDVLEEEIVGGRDSIALLVTHALPYLLLNFDAPNQLCISVCRAVSAFCKEEVGKVQSAPPDHPFIHLATVMTQYASKSFAKDSAQLAKCVLQYICDGVMALNMDAVLCLLSEMLERGWSSLHGHVLHMIYLLVQHSNSAILSTVALNAQVIRAVSRHVQGVHWQVASRVYKAVVEKSQVDQSNDFSLNISSLMNSSSRDRATSPHSPRKNTDATVQPTTTTALGATTSLRRLPPPHIRVRDRLVGILSASGLRVGVLPSATSLVFSRSELGSAASSTERICASSQEVASTTTSLPDHPSASITDSFPRVFKEFDFLEAEHDSVSETADSCFGWLSTMRPTTRTGGSATGDGVDDDYRGDYDEARRRHHDDDYDDDDDEETEPTSSADNERTTTGGGSSRMSRESTVDDDEERTPCPSECDELDHDAFDMGGSSMCGDDDALRRLANDVVSPQTERAGDTSIDGSSVCAFSQVSAAADYYPNRVRTLLIQCQHHLDSKVENEWSSAVTELGDDADGDITAYATLLSTQLYKACCGHVCALLRDAGHLLSNRSLARSFVGAQEALIKVIDMPYLFVSEQFLRTSPLLQRLRLSLFELKEHWETFNERKDACQKALNSLRSAYKLSALGGSTASLNATSELDLGRLLNKLVFQVMLMSDSLKDMTDVVKNSTNSQTYSLSPAILEHHRELLVCASEATPSSSSIDVVGSGGTCSANFVGAHSLDSLVLLMANKRYGQALQAVRSLRGIYGNEFGCCETVDIDVLLLLYCRSHALKAWAIVGSSGEEVRRQSELLREVNADLASCLRRAQADERQDIIRQPRAAPSMSSVTESFSNITTFSERFD